MVADALISELATILDCATFTVPVRLSKVVGHVFVNGTQVLRNGKHSGAKPESIGRGPGWTG
jgi:N-acyl-D-amino-acid deacylase